MEEDEEAREETRRRRVREEQRDNHVACSDGISLEEQLEQMYDGIMELYILEEQWHDNINGRCDAVQTTMDSQHNFMNTRFDSMKNAFLQYMFHSNDQIRQMRDEMRGYTPELSINYGDSKFPPPPPQNQDDLLTVQLLYNST